jgi:hypothetical protein
VILTCPLNILFINVFSTHIWLPLEMSTTSDGNTSDPDFEEPLANGTHERTSSSGPHIQQTDRCRQFLAGTGNVLNRMLQILDLMDKLHINLPLFLWAISWNVPEVTSDSCVCFVRTALMCSDELSGILRNWHRPPHSHGQGIRMKAARKALNDWALDTVCNILDEELSLLKPTMSLPPQELSEEVLLSISWTVMIPEVQTEALTLWRLFRHTLYTPLQDQRNTMKDPDAVQFNTICFLHILLFLLARQPSL